MQPAPIDVFSPPVSATAITSGAIRFDAPRLWLGDEAAGPAVRLFRRVFDLNTAPPEAMLRLFAESRYHVWVNGAYVARGPILHHAHRLPVAEHDITALLKPGKNVLAILVLHFGCALHNYVPTGKPGLVAELAWTDTAGQHHAVRTDDRWRITDRTGWSSDVPRRGWAIGHVEVFDTKSHPHGWTSPDFDDRGWSAPDVYDSALPGTGVDGGAYIANPIPALKYVWQSADRVVSFCEVYESAPPILREYRHGDYASKLMAQKFIRPTRVTLSHALGENGGLRIDGLTPDTGAVVNLDLGAEHAGQIILDGEFSSSGTIDLGWSEYLDGDRPRICQKGTSYVDRVIATQGRFRWEQAQFNAGRYLSLWLRGFTGSVTIHEIGTRATEPALDWQGRLECGDDTIDRIWQLCERTQRIGTQEGLMDCPTREQACYIGDGHPVARWVFQLTGDARHWRYLVTEQFARQAENGLIRSTPFSGRDDTLIDYTLLAVIHTREYLRFTGDADTARSVLDGCRGVLRWFDGKLDARGLLAWAWTGAPRTSDFESVFDPSRPRLPDGSLNLFIDHPGMGWHNVGEAGIDRHGTNAAINALLVVAREAMADLEDAVGSPDAAVRLRSSAAALRKTARETFFDAKRGVFVDGVFDDAQLPQVSQHTNTWAHWAGLWPDGQAREALRRLIIESDASVARGGPYFWLYIFPAMQSLGLHREALDATRRLWAPMLTGGATTLWETFNGDDHDTACHPWSGAPLEFLLTGVAGLPACALPGSCVELRPHFDLFDRMDARLFTAAGPIEIAWTCTGNTTQLRGKLPEGVTATLIVPNGATVRHVVGEWSIQV